MNYHLPKYQEDSHYSIRELALCEVVDKFAICKV
jgi:hypothetical protein